MFSLIITVIAIALVAVLALATLYYGGSAFGKGASRAEASKLLNHGQQLLGAADLYFTEHRKYPDTIDELVTGGYLKQIPTAQGGGVAEALAGGVNWTMPVQGVPMFVTDTAALDVCSEVNLSGSLKQKAVLKSAYNKLVAQCYGDANLKTVFKKDGSIAIPGAATADVPSDPADPDWKCQGDTCSGGTSTSGGGGSGGGGSGGGGTPDTDPHGNDKLYLEATVIDFGDVMVNGWRGMSFAATNLTNAPIDLSQGQPVWSDGWEYGPMTVGPNPDKSFDGWEWYTGGLIFAFEIDKGYGCDPLPAGETCYYWADFQPITEGPQEWNFTLNTPAGAFPIRMKGNAVDAIVRVYPNVANDTTVGENYPVWLSPTPVGKDMKFVGVTFSNAEFAAVTADTYIVPWGGKPDPNWLVSGDDCVFGGGQMISSGNSCSLVLVFQPTAAGTRTTTATVTMEAADGKRYSSKVQLSGTGVAPGTNPHLTFSDVDFGSVAVGDTTPQYLYVQNDGDVSINFTGIQTGGPAGVFGLGSAASNPFGNDCQTRIGGTLNVGAGCWLQVTATPSAQAAQTGTVTIAGTTPAGPLNAVVNLAVVGTPPSSGLYVFATNTGSTQAGTSQSIWTFVQNNSNRDYTFAASTATDPAWTTDNFGPSFNPCGAVLTAKNWCYLYTVFTPGEVRSYSDTVTLNVTSNAGPFSAPYAVSGVGLARDLGWGITANPASFVFTGPVNGAPVTKNITLTNNGSDTVRVVPSLPEAHYATRVVSGSDVMAPGSTYTLAITYTPGDTVGSFDSSLGLNLSPYCYRCTGGWIDPPLPVKGTTTVIDGVAASASPNPINWGTVVVQSMSETQMTLTNVGTAPLTVTRVFNPLNPFAYGSISDSDVVACWMSSSASYYGDPSCYNKGESHNCVGVAPGSSCTVNLHFAPMCGEGTPIGDTFRGTTDPYNTPCTNGQAQQQAWSGNIQVYMQGASAPVSVPTSGHGVDQGTWLSITAVNTPASDQMAQKSYDGTTRSRGLGSYLFWNEMSWYWNTQQHPYDAGPMYPWVYREAAVPTLWQTFSITNNGPVTLTYVPTGIDGMPGDHSNTPRALLRGGNCGATLAPGATCTMTLEAMNQHVGNDTSFGEYAFIFKYSAYDGTAISQYRGFNTATSGGPPLGMQLAPQGNIHIDGTASSFRIISSVFSPEQTPSYDDGQNCTQGAYLDNNKINLCSISKAAAKYDASCTSNKRYVVYPNAYVYDMNCTNSSKPWQDMAGYGAAYGPVGAVVVNGPSDTSGLAYFAYDAACSSGTVTARNACQKEVIRTTFGMSSCVIADATPPAGVPGPTRRQTVCQ